MYQDNMSMHTTEVDKHEGKMGNRNSHAREKAGQVPQFGLVPSDIG